jgi:hypothetical protein
MQRNTFPIDWREEFAALQPFIAGQGGVACIRYAGDRCAPNSFVEVLTSAFEARNGGDWPAEKSIAQSIRIDRHNYKVRYLVEIRTEFIRKMNQDLPSPITAGEISSSVQIASGNVAAGNQSIEAQINYAGDNEVSLQVRRNEWITSLCDRLQKFLESRRFMVVLMHGSKEDQLEFWDGLWHGGMSALVSHGLFLVRMIDCDDSEAGEYHRVAQPDCTVSLPRELNDVRRGHAIDDIAKAIKRWFPDYSTDICLAIAKGFVLSHTDDIARLHNGLLNVLLSLKSERRLNSP